tara:strand:- start:472 stop:729 length:258 start_codon:yes stop_codon:yes gene_type:complete
MIDQYLNDVYYRVVDQKNNENFAISSGNDEKLEKKNPERNGHKTMVCETQATTQGAKFQLDVEHLKPEVLEVINEETLSCNEEIK